MAGEAQAIQAALGLVAPVAQIGFGIYNAVEGNDQRKRAEMELAQLREKLGNTQYADYNQAYYDELQRRANMGLPTEQRLTMEQGANRAVGAALATSEDRRGGLMGIGQAQTSLADAYRNIGMADVAQRNQNAQAMLAEMSNRGTSTYNEQMNLLNYDVATQRNLRQEGIAQRQAGFQDIYGGLSSGAAAGSGLMNAYAKPQMSLSPSAPAPTTSPVFGGTGTNMSSVDITGGAVPTGMMGSVYGVY